MKRLIEGCKFFVASCIPGCGQMYQGYMKRGLSLMLVFCAPLMLAIFLEMGALAVTLVPVWLYSFFDGYNLRRRLEGTMVADDAEPDAYLFGLSDLDSDRLSELLGRRHSVIGWALVLVGVFMLYQQVVVETISNFFEGHMYYFLRWEIPRIVVTILIIALGIWFIRGPKKKHEPKEPPYIFVPPVEPKTAEPAHAPEPFAGAETAGNPLPPEPAWPQVPVTPAEPETAEQEADHD